MELGHTATISLIFFDGTLASAFHDYQVRELMLADLPLNLLAD